MVAAAPALASPVTNHLSRSSHHGAQRVVLSVSALAGIAEQVRGTRRLWVWLVPIMSHVSAEPGAELEWPERGGRRAAHGESVKRGNSRGTHDLWRHVFEDLSREFHAC